MRNKDDHFYDALRYSMSLFKKVDSKKITISIYHGGRSTDKSFIMEYYKFINDTNVMLFYMGISINNLDVFENE